MITKEVAEKLAEKSKQVDLDQDANFYDYYIEAMKLAPWNSKLNLWLALPLHKKNVW